MGVSTVPTVFPLLSEWATAQASSQALHPIHLWASATTKALSFIFN